MLRILRRHVGLALFLTSGAVALAAMAAVHLSAKIASD